MTIPDSKSSEPKSQSALLKIILPILSVLILVSFLWQPKPKKTEDQVFADRIAESVGLVSAEEALKILGEAGGRVALILPGTDDTHFAGSEGGAYERGFQQFSQKHSALHFSGHLLTAKPLLTSSLLLSTRDKFTDADLLISFVGLPLLERGEANEWRQSRHPQIIAMENSPIRRQQMEQLLKLRLVQTVFLRKHILFPKQKPTDAHTLVDLFYQTIRSS